MLVLEPTRPPHARAVLESALDTYRDRIVLAYSSGVPTGVVLLHLVAKVAPCTRRVALHATGGAA